MGSSNETKTIGLIITHNDADGVGAAVVAKVLMPDVDWTVVFCKIGVQDALTFAKVNELHPNIVVISDIGITNGTADFLEKVRDDHGTIIAGFDHHKTNTLDRDWFTVTVSDMPVWYSRNIYEETLAEPMQNVAATYVIYNALRNVSEYRMMGTPITAEDVPHMALSPYVDYTAVHMDRRLAYNVVASISRYDTFTFKRDDIPKNEYITIGDTFWQDLTMFYGPQNTMETMMRYVIDSDCLVDSQIDTMANMLLKQREFKVSNTVIKCGDINDILGVTFDKPVAIYCGGTGYDSMVSNACLTANTDVVDVCVILYINSSRISFRSLPGGIDVGHIAASMGGGGHTNASGVLVSPECMCELIKLYYELKPIEVYRESLNDTTSFANS